MHDRPSNQQGTSHRDEIALRWREVNRLSIELCLTAQENLDPAVVDTVLTGFDSVITQLEVRLQGLAADSP